MPYVCYYLRLSMYESSAIRNAPKRNSKDKV